MSVFLFYGFADLIFYQIVCFLLRIEPHKTDFVNESHNVTLLLKCVSILFSLYI